VLRKFVPECLLGLPKSSFGEHKFIPTSPSQDQCKQLYEELQKCEDMEQESIMMSQMFQFIELDSDSDSLDLEEAAAEPHRYITSVVG
jgi:hypothetical protein